MLKTDLFEEAFGEDQILPGLFPNARLACGIDEAFSTVRSAATRYPSIAIGLAVMDIRQPAWRRDSFDLVISTSTLDHFAHREDFLRALSAIADLVRPGGVLILTLDNPLNPLFHLLRSISHTRYAPFPLGYTPVIATLRRDIQSCGFRIQDQDWLLHNPRGLSTALFVCLSKLLGSRADPVIAALLAAFSLLAALPTRRFTASFQAVAAVRLPATG